MIPVESTAKAAKIASKEPNSAAICSSVGAKMYNLPILFENIEDDNENKTDFIIVSNFENNPSGNDNTAILAKLSKEDGSLVKFLQEFYKRDINLTKIESHIIKQELIFYIEFDGHKDDKKVCEIFELYNHKIKFLGSYIKQ